MAQARHSVKATINFFTLIFSLLLNNCQIYTEIFNRMVRVTHTKTYIMMQLVAYTVQ